MPSATITITEKSDANDADRVSLDVAVEFDPPAKNDGTPLCMAHYIAMKMLEAGQSLQSGE